jgi:uncharacterized protein
MKPTPLCIYHHPCPDGLTAAVIVREAWEGQIECHGMGYYDEPPDVTGRHVIMVDFSLKRPALLEMAESARTILILDHHETAQKELVDLPNNIVAVFDMEKSGAMMAWERWWPGQPAPQFVKHVQDRDLWRFALPWTREIMAAALSYEFSLDQWESFVFGPGEYNAMADLRAAGTHILRAQDKQIREYVRGTSHELTIGGFTVPAVNAPHSWASDAGHILAAGKPFAVAYHRTRKGWKFDLRSDDKGEHVGNIAARLGGGGHPHAAGFELHGCGLEALA